MTSDDLRRVRACVFDAYGTLFDFASAASVCRDVLGDKTGPLTALWRDKQLQYTWLRTLQDVHADFWTVTRDALDHALDALDVREPGIADKLMALYLELKTFPEVPAVLRRIKGAGFKTAILSNGTPAMLGAVVAKAGLEPLLDHVLSVEEVGVFKTDPKVYQLAIDRLGVTRSEIAFMSSNAWDAYAASSFGMRVIWCNRYRQGRERLPGKPDHIVPTLSELLDLLPL